MKKLVMEPADRLSSLQNAWDSQNLPEPGPCGVFVFVYMCVCVCLYVFAGWGMGPATMSSQRSPFQSSQVKGECNHRRRVEGQ